MRTLLPLLLESSTESVAEISITSLERILGPSESDAFLARVYERLVTGCYNIIANHSDPNRSAMYDESNAHIVSKYSLDSFESGFKVWMQESHSMHPFPDFQILTDTFVLRSTLDYYYFLLNLFIVGWMNLCSRNVFSTLKSNLRTAKSARQWRSFFPLGIY